MNSKVLKFPRYGGIMPLLKISQLRIVPPVLLVCLLLIWFIFPVWLHSNDPTAGYIEQNTWLLLVLSLITFLLVTQLCWWLLRQFWTIAGLPDLNKLILKFNHLTSCQQLSFFFASFALLILAAMSCIDAIC
ncbi:hypothetical protein [Pedobacter westerhofensis]|uniref:hypothetical protein n=1 Tax=Pedobacter westerhofensis TaxID=425512 RepID=UPI00115AC320|nr:hypothetical protein [Pedobacter westerhofensis]